MNNRDERGMSRRDVMRGGLAGAAIGSGALAVSTPAEAAHPIPQTWDHDVDVVCIGYGGAGAAAAITAHDAGAKVLILEKMAEGGGNTRVSGGGVLCPTDVPDAITYITSLYEFSHSEINKDIVKVFCEVAVKNVEWLQGLREGTKTINYGGAGYGKLPGAKSMQKHQVVGDRGRGLATSSLNLWALYAYAVEEKRKIPVLLETPAKRLVSNPAGEVIGVIAEQKGKQLAIRARRAVILTTGGYEYSETMKQNYLKGYPLFALGNPGNTGDGIRMAQQMGADLWHMNGTSTPLGIKVPGLASAMTFFPTAPGFIYVDKHGRRFINEKGMELHAGLLAVDYYDSEEVQYPRIPCYAIFDETTRQQGPITALATMCYSGKNYRWSSDNSAEIDKGWVIKGETVADLAGKIKMKPADLEATLAKWNADVKSGADTLFHRPVKAPVQEGAAYQELARPVWSAPIEKAPFFAVELYPAMLNTQGGPRRNVKAQILDVYGEPIPRLYSSGEIGSMWGVIYQGAGNNAESIVFGKIAGTNAAAEKPWA
jgi:succinate dehydrogenase/fumarate reductase flavoprotein subunit